MSVAVPPASGSSLAEANNGICGNCKKALTQGGTTYLYRDQTYCSAHCRAMQMTPSSSASSDAEAGAKPWMIPKFKQKQDRKTKGQETRTLYYSSKAAAPYGNKRWDPVFRSPSTEFLSKYAVKVRTADPSLYHHIVP
uniref:FLZ-type domain-containing protein n=2 Tax=Lotharella oceanica TaxID=641309 RepID=A0A7S2TI08_9EUKA|mmetsp:Transcript_15094/g.28730  ORF Transcript_15094/g.28730 Transcript_15094/m.28730 type:complete len:138 (+) Transcript_15094:220-633(+)